ncbi:hypothetical protein SZ25_00335 [Candidatus Arcanobacter lacustris]|uniref:Uncharacterized protein n=1 Tax=Candidatus Arcanibacter lacustris TaxID=1607817 RepID=A0A0F5MP15_9RICK|nr:hypothetical protein SZ25_00335 [Candidatus Arcanobacter lacustris]
MKFAVFTSYNSTEYRNSSKTSSGEKQVYLDEKNKKWMIDCSSKLDQSDFVTGVFYRLILGQYAPNEQLVVKQEGKLCLGSEFIENFDSIKKFCINRFDFFNDKCVQKTFYNAKNANLVTASMILLGEQDANHGNLGIVQKNNEYFIAKIDHDHSKYSIISLKPQNLNAASSKNVLDFIADPKALSASLNYIYLMNDQDFIAAFDKRSQEYHSFTGNPIDRSYLNSLIARKALLKDYADSLLNSNNTSLKEVNLDEQFFLSIPDQNKLKDYLFIDIFKTKSTIAYEIWDNNRDKHLAKYIDELQEIQKITKWPASQNKIYETIIVKAALYISSYEDAKQIIDIITNTDIENTFFKDKSYVESCNKIYSYYFQNSDEKIAEYFNYHVHKFSYNFYITEFTPSYLIDLASNKSYVAEKISQKFNNNLNIVLSEGNGDIYKILMVR